MRSGSFNDIFVQYFVSTQWTMLHNEGTKFLGLFVYLDLWSEQGIYQQHCEKSIARFE